MSRTVSYIYIYIYIYYMDTYAHPHTHSSGLNRRTVPCNCFVVGFIIPIVPHRGFNFIPYRSIILHASDGRMGQYTKFTRSPIVAVRTN